MAPVCKHLGVEDGVHTVAAMIRDVVDALKFAHGEGYLHRDVSVGNVMWDPVARRGCLIDWHIAEKLRHDTPHDTFTATITGTRLYTAVSLTLPGHVRCIEVCAHCP